MMVRVAVSSSCCPIFRLCRLECCSVILAVLRVGQSSGKGSTSPYPLLTQCPELYPSACADADRARGTCRFAPPSIFFLPNTLHRTIMSTAPASLTKPGLVLLTAGTPNGYKVSIALEELRLAGALPKDGYAFENISFQKNEQKSDWFLEVSESASFASNLGLVLTLSDVPRSTPTVSRLQLERERLASSAD